MVLLLRGKDTPITNDNIRNNLTHLNITCRSHSKSQQATIKGNVLKNIQMVLLLGKKDTPTSKQLTIVFVLT